MKVGVPRETLPGEQRVALVPEVLPKRRRAGIEVLVEPARAPPPRIPTMYEAAGAPLVSVTAL